MKNHITKVKEDLVMMARWVSKTEDLHVKDAIYTIFRHFGMSTMYTQPLVILQSGEPLSGLLL